MAEIKRLEEQVDSFVSQPELIRQAQAVLPEVRRAQKRSSGFASTFFKELRHLESSGHLKAAEPSREVPPSTAAEKDAPEIIVVERKVVVKELPDYGKISTVTLARILLERLGNLEEAEANLLKFTTSLEQKRLQESQYDRRLDTRPPQQQVQEEALRICIVGLLPAQQHEVEERTKNVSKPIRLRFYDSETRTQDFPSHVDYIIAGRFVRHGWWEKAKQTLPNDCIFFLEGGITAIVQKIFDLTSRQTLSNGSSHAPAYAKTGGGVNGNCEPHLNGH